MKKILFYLWKGFAVLLGFLLLLFLVGYFATCGDYPVAKTVEHDNTLPVIELNGYKFHAESFGNNNKQTIITLHGGPGNDYRYILPLKALSDEYKVVFYDQRGAGLSARVPSEQLTLESSIADLRDIVIHFGNGESVILIGHSWGAVLATAYTARYPKQVMKVVLAEPGILTNEAAEYFMNRMIESLSWAFCFHFLTSWFKSLHVSSLDGDEATDFMFADGLMGFEGVGNPMADYYCNKKFPKDAFKMWRFGSTASWAIQKSGQDNQGNYNMEIGRGVDRYQDEVLFIVSECNTFIGEDFQRKYHLKLFRKPIVKVIPKAGHAMFGENTKDSLSVIRAYLKR